MPGIYGGFAGGKYFSFQNNNYGSNENMVEYGPSSGNVSNNDLGVTSGYYIYSSSGWDNLFGGYGGYGNTREDPQYVGDDTDWPNSSDANPNTGGNLYIDTQGTIDNYSTDSSNINTVVTADATGIPQNPSASAAYGNFFYVASKNGYVAIINMATGTLLGDIRGSNIGYIYDIALQGSNTVDIYTDGKIYVYQWSATIGGVPVSSGVGSTTTSTGTTISTTSSSTTTGTTSSSTTIGTIGTAGTTTTTASGTAISLSVGWNLVDAAVAQADGGTNMFFWNGTQYLTTTSGNGEGVWQYESTPQSVTMPTDNTAYYSVQVGATEWGMIGNPYSIPQTVTLQSGDYAFTYAPGSGYSSAQTGSVTLQPGEGAWIYSAAGGTYVVGTMPPAPPSAP
jgi:hypothetical protein